MATVQGQYKGKDIYAGDDAYIAQQMRSIDAASQPVTPAPQPQASPVPQATTAPAASPMAPTPYTPPQKTTPPAQQTQATPPTQPTNVPQANLEPGAQGQQVNELQAMLQSLGYLTPQQIATGPGIYGPQTQNAVARLQKDLGVQTGGNDGYYGPKTRAALAQKYKDAFGQLGKTAAPASQADARAALDGFLSAQPGNEDLQRSYFEELFNMNPVESAIFQQLTSLFNPQTQKQSLMEMFAQETAAQGIPGLQMELADMKKIMDGSEDDIRAEITATGGFATDSQVKALTGARNKVMLREAQYLSDIIQAKEDYVNKIVSLTQADREQVDRDIDRKIGLSQTLLNMTQNMQKNARDNYRNIISDIGYDGLIKQIRSPQDLQRVASALGLTPGTLMELSKVKTTAQRQLQLDEMNYALSVDKFNEDTRRFGLSYALDVQKLEQAAIANKLSQASLYSTERSERALNTAESLKMSLVSKDKEGKYVFDRNKADDVLGTWAAVSGWKPGSKAYDFKSQVEALKSQIAQKELTEMREASKTGGALGNASDKDMELLMASMGNLSTWQSPEQFYKTLNEVIDITTRWQAIKTSYQTGFNYEAAKKAGYTDSEINDYLRSQLY